LLGRPMDSLTDRRNGFPRDKFRKLANTIAPILPNCLLAFDLGRTFLGNRKRDAQEENCSCPLWGGGKKRFGEEFRI